MYRGRYKAKQGPNLEKQGNHQNQAQQNPCFKAVQSSKYIHTINTINKILHYTLHLKIKN